MNPFSDILSRTTTPARPGSNPPPAARVGPSGGPSPGRPSVPSVPSVPDIEQLQKQYLDLMMKNLELSKEKGELRVEDLKFKISELELDNEKLSKPVVCSTPDKITGAEEEVGLVLVSPATESASSPQQHAEDAPWWHFKKRFQSLSVSRYSVATARLSTSAPEVISPVNDDAGRRSEWRRSVESSQLRPSSIRDSILFRSSPSEGPAGNFIEFCTIGVDGRIFDGSVEPRVDIVQPANIIYKFPDFSVPLFIENLTEFIFPGGTVPLYLVLDHNLKSNLRVGPGFDQYQLLQFSDSSGVPTYACCIIVTERITDPSRALVKNLHAVQAQLMAAAIITKFFKGIVVFKKMCRLKMADDKMNDNKFRRFSDYYSRRERSGSVVSTKGGGMLTSITDMVFGLMASSRKNRGQSTVSQGSGIGTELSPQRVLSKSEDATNSKTPHQRTNSMRDASFAAQLSGMLGDDSEVSETSSRSVSLSSDHTVDHSPNARTFIGKFTPGGNPSLLSNSPRTSGRIQRSNSIRRIMSYSSEINQLLEGSRKSSDSEHAVITQRAYCIMSNNPFYAFLFKLLQEISTIYRSNGLIFENSEKVLTEHGLNVSGLLEVAQFVNLFKTLVPRAVSSYFPDAVKQQEKCLLDHVSFSYKCENKGIYQFSSSLRSCTQEDFVLSVLIAFVPFSVIAEIMNHLLLEKSLLICGTTPSLVSIVSTAVVYLLNPMQWDGVFVPLLPEAAMEVLQAPVPFILGIPMLTNRLDERVQKALSNSGGDIAVLKLDENTASNMLHMQTASRKHWVLSSVHEDELKHSMNRTRRLICLNGSCCSDKFNLCNAVPSNEERCTILANDPSLSVFMNHILYHLDAKTKGALNKTVSAIKLRNQSMLGDVIHTDKWKSYGTMDYSTDRFEFYSQWLIDHRRAVHTFQENLFRTQHFSSFMHKLCAQYSQCAGLRYYIACWIYLRIEKRKKMADNIPSACK